MPRMIVNFSAALLATLTVISCSQANSTPTVETGSSAPNAKAAAAPSASPADDAMVAAADKGRIIGENTAKTWVIVASDFQCPFCKEWHDEEYVNLLNEYVKTGKIKVAYINYPLGQHQNAVVTAEAAMCAGVQNKFWEYHDGLFATQARWAPMSAPRPLLDSLAGTVGIDVAKWKQCVDSGKLRPLIRADRDRAATAGVQSTPSFIIGDQVLLGAQPLSALRPVIEATIAKDKAAR
ncbi:MAG TPA: thioredoxin domain-containing protein [Gemmatimonadaceae bacterium]|nr:thioredoxin domain-containing protein [Gemmatimonadaceae bacterium]